MEKLLFSFVSKDIIEFIKEYETDFLSSYLDDLEEYSNNKDYKKMFDEISSTIISENVYHDNDEIYNLYGSLNLNAYIFTYNKKFYNYLYSELEKEESIGCIKFSKFIKILLDSDYEKQSIEDILTILNDNKNNKFKIIYEDRGNKKTERIISDVSINFTSYFHRTMVNAHCHLRNEMRNFKIKSIIEVTAI